ncbi:hypothetical protein GCM10011348_45990 [Marinobacterium nitratireducens]|uniref:Uncharacterized protein n=1 Tax=Marinobacterium nitratireducens TaxID=518897 RepID=A0A917ZSM6_9GAMM|nr:hypothetical protein [Marinobacterium nitratireducens]GGO89079.1 hypothetical protein GCM10011348_45990 [Marinobacterium nitratireducens]
MSDSKRVEKLVEVYLGWLLSTDAEAGWHQPRDYRGDVRLPGGGGYDQADVKMINEIRWLREPHALLPLAKSLIGRLNPKHSIPLIVHHRYAGTINPATGRYWTDNAIALELGVRLKQYRHRRYHAMVKLGQWLREAEGAKVISGDNEAAA